MKIIEIVEGMMDSKNQHEADIHNYDITTEFMEDDFVPARVAESMMLWVGQNGKIGEIELIFPDETKEKKSYHTNKSIPQKIGFPLVKPVRQKHNVSVYRDADGFTIYISDSEICDYVVHSGKLSFYIFEDHIIAVTARTSL